MQHVDNKNKNVFIPIPYIFSTKANMLQGGFALPTWTFWFPFPYTFLKEYIE